MLTWSLPLSLVGPELNALQDELYDYCQKPRRTIREVMEEFRSARIPREYVFDVFPPLRPRQFSIASSIKVNSITADACAL